MVDALSPHSASFDQDRNPWVPPRDGLPSCRRIEGMCVIALRHGLNILEVREALRARKIGWPEAVGELSGDAATVLVARRAPDELIVIAHASTLLEPLMAPGGSTLTNGAFVIDLSHGMVTVLLEGDRLDEWLAHLVDAWAIPRVSCRASRARLRDISVLLVRIGTDQLYVVAERIYAPYLANWLAYAHEGAFGS